VKRCSECGQVYEQSFNFCETDGQALFSVGDISVDSKHPVTNDLRPNRTAAWTTGLIGAMAGIVLCLAVFTVYTVLQSHVDPRPTEVPTYTSQRQQPVQQVRSESARPTDAAAASAETTEAEASEEESPEPSPVQTQEATTRLNDGPISTGQRNAPQAGMQTVIEMTDGSNVIVDAAWQDAQGVWYRRGGLVSFIDSSRVKAITARAEPKNSPTDNQ
jgi:cytoskeletal protein RodZ